MGNITISDQFDNPQGQLALYDTYDLPTRLHINDQKHVDIRSFNNSFATQAYRMIFTDQNQVGSLDTLPMSTLESGSTGNGEAWTSGTVNKQADRNNQWGLNLTCPPSSTQSTQSVIPFANTTDIVSIDLLTNFDDNDYFSIALPAFPLSSIDLTQSWIDLTSNPTGDFTSGPTVSLRMDTSTIPLVNGDSEYRRLRSALTTINIQSVTGVRFRVRTLTTSCAFRVSAIRLLSKKWAYTQLDLDTRLQIAKSTVAPNGSITEPYDFTFPIVLRASQPAGTNDPKPINLSVGAAFNAGTKNNTNNIRLIFREGPGDFTQQLDLNGKTMALLDGKIQPDITSESWRGRTQIEMDSFRQRELLGDKQVELERTIDPNIVSYLSAFIQWSAMTTTVVLSDSEGNSHTFNDVGTLVANGNYIFIVDLVDKTMRARIYPTDVSGNVLVDQIIFDTLIINNEFIFLRRPGRFGWTASLADGDAYIDNINTRNQVYAELKTSAYSSLTPVVGAEVYVAGSGPLEFFDQLYAANFKTTTATINRDRDQSTTGLSWRVNNPGYTAPQGVQTNLADFYDFNEMEISFDLYYPSAALARGIELEAYLSNDFGRIIPIPLGKILPDRWQSFKLVPGGSVAQTGRYRFFLVQTRSGLPTTWWVDNIHITERTLSFYARSVAVDPWGDIGADWVPFKNNINQEFSGVQFIERGRNLQILSQAHRQSSQIDHIKVIPLYAQLGNFVWGEDELYNPQNPIASFTTSVNGLTVGFNGTGSSDPDGDIINYRWNFGDGSGSFGPVASHTYRKTGTYTPSLIVIDSNGLQSSSQTTFFITNV